MARTFRAVSFAAELRSPVDGGSVSDVPDITVS